MYVLTAILVWSLLISLYFLLIRHYIDVLLTI